MQYPPESTNNSLSRFDSSHQGQQFDVKTLRSWRSAAHSSSQQVSQTELIRLVNCSMDRHYCPIPAHNLRGDILSVDIRVLLLDIVNLIFLKLIVDEYFSKPLLDDSTRSPDQSLKCCCCILIVFYWVWCNLISSRSYKTASERRCEVTTFEKLLLNPDSSNYMTKPFVSQFIAKN